MARNVLERPLNPIHFTLAILPHKERPRRAGATPAATNLRNMKGGSQNSQQKIESRYATEFKDLDEPLADFIKRKVV